MTTKTAVANFNFKRGYSDYLDDADRPMTRRQRRTIEEFIFSRVSNPEEVERRLAEIESYNYTDALEVIEDFLFAPWK